MTYEEALASVMNDGINLGAGDYLPIETLYKCKEALGKQIPKKPKYEKLPNNDEYWYCPNCGEVILSKIRGFPVINEYNHKHCSGCGQAIDWGDTE